MAAPARADTVDLDYVECSVTVTRPLIGSSSSPIWTAARTGLAQVTANAVLLTFDPDDDGDPKRKVIARATAYTVDLERLDDIVDAFDEMGGEAFEVVENVMSDTALFDALDAKDGSSFAREMVSQLVVVESVTVDAHYRGQRIGPRLLTTLVDTVAGPGDQTLIVLRAQPLQWQDLSEHELRRAQKKVGASYESIGFAHLRDGIYWRHNMFIGAENLEAP